MPVVKVRFDAEVTLADNGDRAEIPEDLRLRVAGAGGAGRGRLLGRGGGRGDGVGGAAVSGYEVIYTFADDTGAAIAQLDAESFEEAVAHALLRVPGHHVKRIELTDLTFEDAAACEERAS